MKFGIVTPVQRARDVVLNAKAAEDAGFWGIGVPDTAPKMFQGSYPMVTASLLATSGLHVGPFVTNPVTHHWSVHAATHRALDELAPGRPFLGISTGDGAVRSVGLEPASWDNVEESLVAMRPYSPDTLDILVAASGPKGADVAGRCATDYVIGVGLDAVTLKEFSARARSAQVAAGTNTPLRTWCTTTICVLASEADAGAARLQMRGIANARAHYALAATFEGKNVPEQWHSVLREGLRHYDYGSHGFAKGNTNDRLFEDHPELQDYLIDRMLIVGTSDQIADRLAAAAGEAHLDGAWMGVIPWAAGRAPTTLLPNLAKALHTRMGES